MAPQVGLSVRRPVVTCRYSRLAFHRASIEALGASDVFRIETPDAAFEMSKADFYKTFPGVVKSKTYAKGLYSYTQVPRKAARFLVESYAAGTNVVYSLPAALRGECSEAVYRRWLQRKAAAHVVRDRRRWGMDLAISGYKRAIHRAVEEAGKHDAYTGELLDWTLISKYDNEKSKRGGAAYKRGFALLPTVDHAGDEPGDMNFKICAWRTNDAKSDLPFAEFVQLCWKVVSAANVKQRS